MCNEANSIRCSMCMIKREGTGYFLFFFWDRQMCRNKRSREGKRSKRRRRRRRRCKKSNRWWGRRKKKRVDNSVLFMHERQWFFFSYICIHYFLHSPKLAPCMFMCVCMLAAMRCRTRSRNKRHIYTEREGENNGVIRCSSCGTNLVSLVFFLAFSSCYWCWCVFSLSPQTYHQAIATTQH